MTLLSTLESSTIPNASSLWEEKIVQHSWYPKNFKNMLFSMKLHLNTGYANLTLHTSTRSNTGVILWKSITLSFPACQARKTSFTNCLSCIETITDSESLPTKIFSYRMLLRSTPSLFLTAILKTSLSRKQTPSTQIFLLNTASSLNINQKIAFCKWLCKAAVPIPSTMWLSIPTLLCSTTTKFSYHSPFFLQLMA